MRGQTALLLAFLIGLTSSTRAFAQPTEPPEVKPVPGATGPIAVTLNAALPLRMSNKAPIESVRVEKEGIIQVKATNPTTLSLFGMGIGITKIYLTAQGGKRIEVFEVIVQQDLELLKSLLRQVVPTAPVTPIPAPGDAIILIGTVYRVEDIPLILAITRGK